MRISFSRSGGLAAFPGLAAPVTLDTAAMEPAEARALERMVRDLGFSDLPSRVGSARAGAADYRTYEITVEDEGRSHTIRVIEPIADPALQSLVTRLERHRRAPPSA
jgi:hypothetical protein